MSEIGAMQGFVDDFVERLEDRIEEEADTDNGYIQHYCEGLRRAQELAREMRVEYEKTWEEDQEATNSDTVTDPLTGLYNRRGLEVFADHFIRLARREKKIVLLIVIDIDGLKPVNDNLGRAVGDELIKGAAKVLQEVFRKSDVCCRIGGDEFAILAVSNPGFKIQDRIRQAVSRFNASRNSKPPLSLSAGVRSWEPPATLDDAILAAEEIIQRIKKATPPPPPPPVQGDD